MPQTNPVNWFEIPVTDLPRAKKFYERAFAVELSLQVFEGSECAWFPMEMGSPGAAGTLIKGDGYTPSHSGALVYLSVEDIEATLKTIDSAGGKTLVPKTDIGEHGFFAQFEDTEGNRVAIHSQS